MNTIKVHFVFIVVVVVANNLIIHLNLGIVGSNACRLTFKVLRICLASEAKLMQHIVKYSLYEEWKWSYTVYEGY